MASTECWTCPTCDTRLASLYCPDCGERVPSPRDLTLLGILHQLFLLFSSYDSRLLRSFRTLVLQPGKLTVAYVRGQRKIYVGPFQLFIVANVLLFATQSLTASNFLTTTLEQHLNNEVWSPLAQVLVTERLAVDDKNFASYAEIFDLAVGVYAKSLLILMAFPFSLVVLLLFIRARQPFAAHVIFTLHFLTFVLLMYCLALVFLAVGMHYGGAGFDATIDNTIANLINTFIFIGYLYFATSMAYGARGLLRVIKTAVLALAVGAIFDGYRFVIFLITLYSTA